MGFATTPFLLVFSNFCKGIESIMPIANCIISSEYLDLDDNSKDLIRLWVEYSGIQQAGPEMTVNMISSNSQKGKEYAVMATVLLPSIWSKNEISALQKGLARALSAYYSLPNEQVFITTSIVDTGLVVENGSEITW